MAVSPVLPAPVDDLAKAKVDLHEWGYCVLADALKPDELTALRTRLVEQAAGERTSGVGVSYDFGGETHEGRLERAAPNQRVFHLVNKGKEFRDLALHPDALSLIESVLGSPVLLSSLTANIAGPGGQPQDLHEDQFYVTNVLPDLPRVPFVANVAWALDDLSAANGATRFVPRSHALTRLEEAEGTEPVAVEAPAGSAIVFDGRLLHGTGANQTQQARHVILAYYCLPFLRQQENPFLALAPAVIEEAPHELLRLLGFRPWYALGRVYDLRPTPRDGLHRRPTSFITALDASGRPHP